MSARLPIFLSASRRRCTRQRITVIVISKFSERHFLNSRFESTRRSQGSRAITLADLGLSSIGTISPKYSLGPSRDNMTWWPESSPIMTLSLPEITR